MEFIRWLAAGNRNNLEMSAFFFCVFAAGTFYNVAGSHGDWQRETRALVHCGLSAATTGLFNVCDSRSAIVFNKWHRIHCDILFGDKFLPPRSCLVGEEK